MNSPIVVAYLTGMETAGSFACGLFFVRFWARSRDFLFAAFAMAFWLLALNGALVTFMSASDDRQALFYLLRITAYLLIVVAIVRKNAGAAERDDD